MADMGTEITTPVGRIVWGHPCTPQIKTDQQTRQPVLNAQGQQIQQWAFGIAIPKADFQNFVWPAMAQEAMKGYPTGQWPQGFSWKYKDGDGVDREGKPYSAREGWAGCMVLTCSTEFQAPNVFKLEGNGYRQMQPNEIKCGDFVRVGINLKVNVPTNRQHTPGLYVNPLAVEFVGYGEEIKGAFQADPTQLFGGQQVQLPPGASATPIAPQGGAQMPGMGVPQQQQPQYAPPPGQPQYQQPQQQYAPPPGQPQYQQPQQQYAPPPMGNQPGVPPAATGYPAAGSPAPGNLPPPAHGFVDHAGQQQPQYAPPQGQPQYQQPGQMPGMPAPR